MVGGSGRRQCDRMLLPWLEGVGGDSVIACRCHGWREWECDRMLLPWLEGVGGDSVIACCCHGWREWEDTVLLTSHCRQSQFFFYRKTGNSQHFALLERPIIESSLFGLGSLLVA